jgi:hypothetical protein
MMIFCFVLFVCFGSIGVLTQGLTPDRQALYHLTHYVSPNDGVFNACNHKVFYT